MRRNKSLTKTTSIIITRNNNHNNKLPSIILTMTVLEEVKEVRMIFELDADR